MSRRSALGQWRFWLSFPLEVALAVYLTGYQFGRSDHHIHLVFLRRAARSDFLAGDWLADAAAHHHSWFWTLQAPWLGTAPMERIADVWFLLWLLAIALMIAVGRSLPALLWREQRLWPGIGLGLALALPRPSWGAIRHFEAIFVNRTAVLPFQWMTLALLLAPSLGRRRDRWRALLAGALFGLLFLLHATTTTHLLLLIGVVLLVDPLRRHLIPPLVLGFAPLAALLAVPALLERAAAPPEPAALVVWEQLIRWRLAHHLFSGSWSWAEWVESSWPLLALPLAALFSATRPRLWWGLWLGALLGGPVIGGGLALFPMAPWISLHWWEVGAPFTIAGLVAVFALLPILWSRGRAARICAIGLVAALLLGAHGWLIPLLLWCGALLGFPAAGKIARPLAALAGLGLLLAAPRSGPLRPSLRLGRWRMSPPSRERALYDWLRENTPPDAVIAVDPAGPNGVSAFAERGVVVDLKAAGEVQFDPRQAARWARAAERQWGCAPWEGAAPPARSGSRVPRRALQRALQQCARAGGPDAVLERLVDLEADYLVWDRRADAAGGGPVSALPVWESERYQVYRLNRAQE